MASHPCLFRFLLCTIVCINTAFEEVLSAALGSCDFEASLCNYTQATDDDIFEWNRHSGSFLSINNNGPSYDHTTGSIGGSYVYTDARRFRARGDVARLISPRIPRIQHSECFVKFWYFMFGNGIIQFNVFTKEFGFEPQLINKWSHSGPSVDRWINVSFEFTPQSAFQVIFKGVYRSGYRGGIAVDDIEVSNCNSITVDTTPPEIQGCPFNINATTELGTTRQMISWIEPTATDLSGTLRKTQSHQPGAEFSLGVTAVRYTFTDTSNNVATCDFSVTLITVDTTPPKIQGCPVNIEATTELGTTRQMISWTDPTATDLSGTPRKSRSHQPGAEFSLGVTAVLYTFTDTSYNVATCSISVTLTTVDTTLPEIQGCPVNINATIELGTTRQIISWIEPTATDLSGTPRKTRSHQPGEEFSLGVTAVQYTFIDTSNNGATCNFSVALRSVDTTPPEIQRCPVNIEVTTELGTTNKPISWTEPTATDLSEHRITQSHQPGEEFSVGVTTVQYTFIDTSNNVATCDFSVILETVDTTPPLVKGCPENCVAFVRRPVNWIEPIVSDLSENVTVAKSLSPGTYVRTTTPVVYTFTDSSENKAYCNFTIFPVDFQFDTTAPTISNCPHNINTSMELGSNGRRVTWQEPTFVDESGNVTLFYQTHNPGSVFTEGFTKVVYLVTDPSNNIAVCSFSVHVISVDTTPPQIMNCPSDINTTTEVGTSGTPVSWPAPFATDNSGLVVTSSSYKPGQIFSVGATHVVSKFQDKSSNQAFCGFIVNVEYGEPGQTIHKTSQSSMPFSYNTTMWISVTALTLAFLLCLCFLLLLIAFCRINRNRKTYGLDDRGIQMTNITPSYYKV